MTPHQKASKIGSIWQQRVTFWQQIGIRNSGKVFIAPEGGVLQPPFKMAAFGSESIRLAPLHPVRRN
jgi:hypothetical protein